MDDVEQRKVDFLGALCEEHPELMEAAFTALVRRQPYFHQDPEVEVQEEQGGWFTMFVHNPGQSLYFNVGGSGPDDEDRCAFYTSFPAADDPVIPFLTGLGWRLTAKKNFHGILHSPLALCQKCPTFLQCKLTGGVCA